MDGREGRGQGWPLWDLIRPIPGAHPFGVTSLFKIAPGDFVLEEQGNNSLILRISSHKKARIIRAFLLTIRC